MTERYLCVVSVDSSAAREVSAWNIKPSSRSPIATTAFSNIPPLPWHRDDDLWPLKLQASISIWGHVLDVSGWRVGHLLIEASRSIVVRGIGEKATSLINISQRYKRMSWFIQMHIWVYNMSTGVYLCIHDLEWTVRVLTLLDYGVTSLRYL